MNCSAQVANGEAHRDERDAPRRPRIKPVDPAGRDQLEAGDQRRESDAGQDESLPVHWRAFGMRQVWHDARGDEECCDAQRQVDDEDPAPGGIRRQHAAERGCDHRRDQRWPGQIRKRLDQLSGRGLSQDDEPANRYHHRAADSLQDAKSGELAQAGADRAQARCDGEHGDGSAEDDASPEPISEPPADRNEDAQGEQVGRNDDVQINSPDAEGARHSRRCGRDDGAVEVLHEECAGNKECHRPPRRSTSGADHDRQSLNAALMFTTMGVVGARWSIRSPSHQLAPCSPLALAP